MPSSPLSSEQRKQLSRAVISARTLAEDGAREALKALAVDHHEPFGSMNDAQRKLRNALRAHGRQLGDALDSKRGTQEIDRLAHEVAFEHWHRMLFARFLAENDLLIHPDEGVPVSIADCEDLAREQSTTAWQLAAKFAQGSLPAIFRVDDPALRVALPSERRVAIERLVMGIPPAVFTGSDSLGWVYQFWQAEKKDEVNASGNKIGADELPSVTQLFTEDYMVDFLLDNTLGAWWAGKVLAKNTSLATNARSEDELRQAASLPGCPWNYLRFIKSDAGEWKPAAGTFDGWPKSAAEITCLDPCMGSGHFVVAMFERVLALRVSEERLDETTAVAAVIRDNMFGLELDPRCTQIAAFNLALAAWRRVGHCKLPAMNLACSGLAPNTREADWVAIAGSDSKLRNGMERLYRLFKDAPVLGSLINPRAGEGDLLVAAFHELQPLLEKALAQETKDDTAHEMAVTARGLAKAAEILAGQFMLVATNVPYLGRGKQDDVLTDYCKRVHPEAKADLATCFTERGLAFCARGGSAALVTPQNWFFQAAYKKLRVSLLSQATWNAIARLGEGGFESSSAAGAFTAMLVLTNHPPAPDHAILGLEASQQRDPVAKAAELLTQSAKPLRQAGQMENPDHKITLLAQSSVVRLTKYCSSFLGLGTGDYSHYGRGFWEFLRLTDDWTPQQSTVEDPTLFGGRHYVLAWCNRENRVRGMSTAEREQIHNQDQSGQQAWGSPGVAVGLMRDLKPTLYTGEKFEKMLGVLLPRDASIIPALWCYCSSPDFAKAVRELDNGVVVANATLAKVPFDLAHWQKVAAEKYPHGLPKPFSSDPTQWLFNGHPAGADQPLHVAVARLLGYQWPRQTGSSFPDCPALGADGLETHADDDGIVPINPMRGEPAASERLLALLRDAYKSKDLPFDLGVANKLLADTGSKHTSLGDWLLNEYFEQHCKLFHNRPFVWHIWDGRKDGFNVLVNYHRLTAPGDAGRRLLEKLTYDYLKDWINRQHAGIKANDSGAEARLAAALTLQKELVKILEGETPYDIFVRWKPLAEQAIGWHPDINDGVRMNIRPFLLAEDMGKKAAGVLRVKPNIKWDKDRGKEPERSKVDFPWFWSCDPEANAAHGTDFTGGRALTGERWNDLHYTLATKNAARERCAKEKK